MWPYSYDSCDLGTFPNQTATDGTPPQARVGGIGGGPLSYLPGQKTSSCTVRSFYLAWRTHLSAPFSSALDQITPVLRLTQDAMRQKSISLRPKLIQRSIKAGFRNHSKSRPSTTSTSSITHPLPRLSTTPRLPTSTRTRVENSSKLSLQYLPLTVTTTTTLLIPPMVTSIGRTHPAGKMDTSLGIRRANKLGRLLRTRLAPIVPPGSVEGSYQRNPW